jgi:hypothetical protein
MMASTTNVILCAGAALVLWTCVGLAVARAVLPQHTMAWAAAPALGWAVHSAVALPLFSVVGFSRPLVAVVTATTLAASAYALWRQGGSPRGQEPTEIPFWAWIGAALLAAGVATAILPKAAGDSVYLARQIFDHSKIAIIDEMIRNGLPPGNPFYGEAGQPSRLVYYYLMHFSAAELALLLGFSGWEGDAALTWFTAFASIMLMIGLAIWLGGRRIAALFVLLVTAASSIRPLLDLIPGIDSVIAPASGFGSWLLQVAWAPQHVAATSCVVIAILLLIEMSRRDSIVLLLTFILVVVAGYQSSSWVGGVTFAAAAAWIGCVLLVRMQPRERWPFLGRCAVAAFCAAALAAPFLYDQSAAMAGRGVAWPVALQTYEVMGDFFPPILRRMLDLPAFWLILLPIEMPAIYVTGVLAMRHFSRAADADPSRKQIVMILIHLAAVSAIVSWVMASTVGGGNDLGWRAILPGVVVTTAFAAAGLAHWLAMRNMRLVALAAVSLLLGLPAGIQILYSNAVGTRNDAAKAFAATPELWAAVRKHAGPTDRIANNPLFLDSMTPWPSNISWALLSNRRSCYAGAHLAVPFMPMPLRRVNEIDAVFNRVFTGDGWPDDLRDLAAKYDCKIAVVTELDGAWTRDPFANSSHWRLVEKSGRGWRIYRAQPIGLAYR